MSGITPETLMRHAGFVRSLAFELLRSADRVDDVVQETMLAAVRRPPRDPSRLRAWLGAVGRRIALQQRRSDGRRPRREREAARPEGLPSAAELAAQVETQRRLVEAVQALEEPYRSTVLLRFFHDRSVREIAEAGGEPAKTVESRLTRALAQLRARLEREHGGGRAWSLALLPLAVPRTAAAATATALPLGVLAAAAALLLVGFVGWQALDTASRTPGRNSVHAEASTRAPSEPEAPAAVSPSVPRTDGAGEAVAPSAGPEPEWSEGAWRARVIASDGSIPERVRVRCFDLRRGDREVACVPGDNGWIRVRGLPAGAYRVAVLADGYAPWRGGDYLVTRDQPEGGNVLVILGRGSTLRVVLRDSAGNPRKGTALTLNGGPWDPTRAAADASGTVTVEHLASAVYHFALAGQIWYPRINGKRDVEWPITVDATVEGVLHDPTGAPCRGTVRFDAPALGWTECYAGEDGAYRLRGLSPGAWNASVLGNGFAGFAGTLELDGRPAASFPIVLGPGSISGRVGEPTGPLSAPSVAHLGLYGTSQGLSLSVSFGREFSFWGLPAGEYTLTAQCDPGLRIPDRTIRLGEQDSRSGILLVPEALEVGTIELDVRCADGRTPEMLQLFVSSSRSSSTSAAPDPVAPGRFPVRLPAGDGRITIGADSTHGAAIVQVRAVGGETRVVAVVLPPAGETREIDAR